MNDNTAMSKLKLRLKQKKSTIVVKTPTPINQVSPWKFASARINPTIPKWQRISVNLPGVTTRENMRIIRTTKMRMKTAVRKIERCYRSYKEKIAKVIKV